jgi:hypothetical protein
MPLPDPHALGAELEDARLRAGGAKHGMNCKQDSTPGPLHANVVPGSAERAGTGPRAGGGQHSSSEAADLLHRLQQLESAVAALSSKVDALEGARCAQPA